MIVGKYKKYCHKFQYTQGRFLFVPFCFAIYKMVHSMDIFKSNISIGTLMRNPEKFKFVLDYRKIRKICKHGVKKLAYLLTYVSDLYKT